MLYASISCYSDGGGGGVLSQKNPHSDRFTKTYFRCKTPLY